MLNITQKELLEMANMSDNKIKELKLKIGAINTDIGQLSRERDTAVEGLKKEEKRVVAIREATVLNGGIPHKVSAIRETLLKVMSQAKRRDITIAKQERLKAQEEELKKELQQKCNHLFVFHKEGFSGSYSDDYEDGYPSERYCAVCGLGEKAKDFAQNGRVDNVGRIFETLKSSEERVVHREPYRQFPKTFSRTEIWIPLEAVLKPFEESIAKALNE